MQLTPITLREAYAFVTQHHRHHGPPAGAMFAVAVATADTIRGVAIVGRPTARMLDDGFTAEVTRLCTDGTPNACSKLYAASWRATRALGYTRIVTYILGTETGASIRAAGWREIASVRGKSWSCPSRPRVDTTPHQAKIRFEQHA